jgi:hypothetical protein
LTDKGIYSREAVIEKCIDVGNQNMFTSMFKYYDDQLPKILNRIYRRNGCSEEVARKIRDMLVAELCSPLYDCVVLHSYDYREKRAKGLILWVAKLDPTLAIPVIAKIADNIDYEPHHTEYSVYDETGIANAIVNILHRMIDCRVPIGSVDNFISLVPDFASKVKHMSRNFISKLERDITLPRSVPGVSGFLGSGNLYILPENNEKRLELLKLLGLRDYA